MFKEMSPVHCQELDSEKTTTYDEFRKYRLAYTCKDTPIYDATPIDLS